MISVGVDPMTTQIVRVGNTLTVEIPEELVAQAALPVGEPVEWVANGAGSISLVSFSESPARKKPADMTLEELMEGLNEGDSLGEYDWGPPRGVEVW
jgi:antitoxin component of MazEF toxin-antitoxin module